MRIVKFILLCVNILFNCFFYTIEAQEFDANGAWESAGVTTYFSMLNSAPVALARTYASGKSSTKGIVGETLASKYFLQKTMHKSGNWHSISPRIGINGIDHIFLKLDEKTAIPKGIIIGESKYNTSQLGLTKDGLQLTSSWINPRLRAMGNRYIRLSNVSTIQKSPFLGGNHEMKIILKNGKEVFFWRKNSLDSWKFSGNNYELHEAKKLAKVYGQYLNAAGKGEVIYRSRLFQIKPRGNDLIIITKNASDLINIKQVEKLPVTSKLILSGVLKDKAPFEIEKEIAKSLKTKFPYYSDKELIFLAKNINSSMGNILTPYNKIYLLGSIAANAGIAGMFAMILDSGTQYISTGTIETEKIMFTGGAVLLGSLLTQGVELSLAQWSVSQGLLRSMSQTVGLSTPLLGNIISSSFGGFITGLVFSYGSYFLGYADIEAANKMALASSIGTGMGLAAGCGTLAIISTYGVASTGTAIAALNGAAATQASLAILGGGTLAAGGGGAALGSLVLTGGIALVAIATTGAVMIVYQVIDSKKEFSRITKLCELFSSPSALDAMINNTAIPLY